MKWVIEFRNGSFFKDLEADHGTSLDKAKRFDTKAECTQFMDAHQWIYWNGGMAMKDPT